MLENLQKQSCLKFHFQAAFYLKSKAKTLGLHLPYSRTECPHSAASAYYLATEGLGLTCVLAGELHVFQRISAIVANAAQSAKNIAVLNVLKKVFRGE